MERLQVEEMMGMVKEMVVLRRNRESNMESIIKREQKEALRIKKVDGSEWLACAVTELSIHY